MTDDTPILRLKKNEERRLKAGHEWIYANEVDTAHSPLKSLPAAQARPLPVRQQAQRVEL